MAAYECESLKFPEPPYPDRCVLLHHLPSWRSIVLFPHCRIICPDALNGTLASSATGASVVGDLAHTTAVTLWAIIGKVRLESFMWGAGTALGELPPYFMAKAGQ